MLNPTFNLTEEQETLLKWMSTGRTFQVYSDYGSVINTIIPASRLPVRVFDNTIKKLYRHGLIAFNSVDNFGQRWDEFSLTNRGREAVCTIA